MTKIILSTSNLMGSGTTIPQRALFEKSNTELVNGLRANFQASQEDSEREYEAATNGVASTVETSLPARTAWIRQDGDQLFVPDLEINESGLAEERSQYEITVKLFFLPTTDQAQRGSHTEEAIKAVLKELEVSSIDLLIISFPGITFDADDEELEEGEDQTLSSSDLDEIGASWKTLEALQESGTIRQIGVSEFGSERLKAFLPKTRIRPSVDQINVRDCCVVPKSLIMVAKQEKIELLTHNDCTDILPKGTIRELLKPVREAVADDADSREILTSLDGDIEPQWVIKYTAVVSDRGVIENKGYFAMAQTSRS